MADARPFHWEYKEPPVEREAFRVQGGQPLLGSVAISGAKNAALKLLGREDAPPTEHDKPWW